MEEELIQPAVAPVVEEAPNAIPDGSPEPEPTLLTGFESQGEEGLSPSAIEQGFSDLYAQQQAYHSENNRATNTSVLLTALARTDPSKNIAVQLTDGALAAAREQLELGQEAQIRSEITLKRTQRQLANLAGIIKGIDMAPDPALVASAQAAYDRIRAHNQEQDERTAIEEAAIDRIRTMAATDPVQARVLLNNMEFGNAEDVTRDFQVKMSLLRQRSEELDEKYQNSGWGRFLINTALSVIPGNFNFAQTGVIGTASFWDIFTPGSRGQAESIAMWQGLNNMSLAEAAEFLDKNGPLMQSIADNATSWFDLVDDPGVASQIMDQLITYGESDKVYNNIWGAVEIASIVPWGKLSSATRTLVTSGAAKDAVRNIDNAARILEERGPIAMTEATGVTERELVDELSVTAIKGTDDGVPLAEPARAHREAAEQVSREILNSPETQVFRSTEEVQAWANGRIDELTAYYGQPLKDVNIKPVELPGGKTVYQMEFTVGKKDGFGYATAGAAKKGLKEGGLAGEVIPGFTTRTVPKFIPESKLENFSGTKGVDGDPSFYTANIKHPNGETSKVSLRVEADGTGKIDIEGLNVNELGPKEVRAIAAQLADEIPELKTLEGPRSTGARQKAAILRSWAAPDAKKALDEISPDNYGTAKVNVEGLRGQTRTIRDMSGQFFNRITVDMPEAGWLTGKLEPPQQGFVSKMIGRWFQATPRISDNILHGQSLEAGSYLNRADREIQEKVMGVFRALPKESRILVGELGKRQTIYAKWYTPEEIDFLTDRALGRKATEIEQQAMADLRLFDDMDWRLRNTAKYLDGLSKGQSSVKFKTKWGEEVNKDVVVDFNMERVPTERVYDASRGKHYVHGRNPLDTKTLQTMKNNGYVMVTFPEGFKLPEGIVTNKVLIKKVDIEISPLRQEQLAYSPGGHRMYVAKNFVKQGRTGIQADTGTKYLLSPNTHRTGENIADVKRWAAKMEEARLAVKENRGITSQELDDNIFQHDRAYPTGEEFLAGITDETYNLEHPFEGVFDRDLPSMYNTAGEDVSRMFNEDELGVNGYYRTTGRMYTSRKGEILRSTTGEVADILDPYDTLSHSLNQVTRQIGLYNYKINAIERFANTYKPFLMSDPNLRSPAQILSDAKVSPTASTEMRNQIESQRAAIQNVLRFETPADRSARLAWQTTLEHTLGDGTNLARKIAHDAISWWRTSDPVSSLRGIAFDMKLGMFNPAQLLVQSSTMFSAMALSPKFGMQGMAGLFPMHAYILKGGSENVLDLLTKRGVGKAMGFKSDDEFKAYARHAYKHGFMEMNGSHIMINNHGPNAHFGSFGEKSTRVREQGRVFFYTSEIWNRLVAYRIAWGETAAKGLTPNNPEFNATILRIADEYAFNMTSESAAYWQKGWKSIPTQFWAYNMRMMDAMFGKRFSVAQRARLIAMNIGIAGSAGVPGLQALSEFIKQKNGKSPEPDSIQAMADRGLIDYFNYQMTGTDVVIGERLGTGGWASDTVKAAFGQSAFGQPSFVDLMGGATYSIAKSTSSTVHNLIKYAAAESGADGTGEITKDNLIALFLEISTFSNANKAYLLHQYGMYRSNKGTVLASDLPPAQALYAALSFRPSKADEIGYMLAWTKDRSDAQKEIAKQLRNWRQEAMITGDYEKYWNKANTLIQLVPVGDRKKVLKRANETDEKSFYDYLEKKVSEEQTEEEVTEGLN